MTSTEPSTAMGPEPGTEPSTEPNAASAARPPATPRRRRGRVVGALVLLAALAGLGVAPAVADDKRAAAERYFRTGERLLDAGELAAAAGAFDEAYAILPLPELAFSAAQAHRLAYVKDRQPARVKRAVELYRRYLEQVKRGGRVKDATAALAELEPELRRLEVGGAIAGAPAARTTGLLITSEVPAARGRIGADPAMTELPLVREVAAGTHEVTVEADGYQPKTVSALAIEGELIPVEVALSPLPAHVAIEVEHGARVQLDGRTIGTAPLGAPIEVDAGRHVVTITRRGRRAVAREIEVARGETLTVAPRLRPTTQRKAARWVLYGAGALVVGAGLAGAGALAADGEAADLDERRRRDGITVEEAARYDRLRGRRDDLTTTMYTLGGLGLAAGIAGGLLYYLDRDEAEVAPGGRAPAGAGRVTFAPAVGGAGVGVLARGRF